VRRGVPGIDGHHCKDHPHPHDQELAQFLSGLCGSSLITFAGIRCPPGSVRLPKLRFGDRSGSWPGLNGVRGSEVRSVRSGPREASPAANARSAGCRFDREPPDKQGAPCGGLGAVVCGGYLVGWERWAALGERECPAGTAGRT